LTTLDNIDILSAPTNPIYKEMMMPRKLKGKSVAWRRSIGIVVRLRVPPRDVMSCIDCVQAAKAEMTGMSISAVIRRGMSIAMGTLRSNKVIPERDGYEYEQMVAPYDCRTGAEKITAGHLMVIADQNAEINDTPVPTLSTQTNRTVGGSIVVTPREARLNREKIELLFRQEQDPLNFDEADQKKLEGISRELQLIHQQQKSA
jgi:hypothetical protein